MALPPLLVPGPTPTIIGVVHLLPLPGAPRGARPLAETLLRARQDAQVLADAGVDGIIVENLGDAPFTGGVVDPWTVAALTLCVQNVRDVAPATALGVNVLRNDARAALGIAHVCEADFIRVNVHIGTMVTDQGVITGAARQTLLDRQLLGSHVAIAADVLVKHAAPLGDADAAQVARDTAHRGGADVLIVSGSGTGRPLDPAHAATVRNATPAVPLWAGSGVTPQTWPLLAPHLTGAIVGTWLHHDDDLELPLDPSRVATLCAALRS